MQTSVVQAPLERYVEALKFALRRKDLMLIVSIAV